MPTVYVSAQQSTKKINYSTSPSMEDGFVAIGSFVHPDATYPDSYVIWHGIRKIAYFRNGGNVAQTAFFPDNLTNLNDWDIYEVVTGSDPVPVGFDVYRYSPDTEEISTLYQEGDNLDVYEDVRYLRVVPKPTGSTGTITLAIEGEAAASYDIKLEPTLGYGVISYKWGTEPSPGVYDAELTITKDGVSTTLQLAYSAL